MSQDPFSPHDDVSFWWFLSSFLPPDFFIFLSQDGFGPFSDPSGTVNSNNIDTFTFSSSFSDEDSSFDSFGDFGDFQTAEDHDHEHEHDSGGGGSLTPTSGSWTFANEIGGSVDSSSINSSSGGGGGSASSSSLAAR